jgi:nucleosome binding factor SPN SPT16 subunit
VKVGSFVDEPQTGEFAKAWDTFINGQSSVELVSISEFVSELLVVKDVSEQVGNRISVLNARNSSKRRSLSPLQF